jgi:hypothetical protein
MKGAAKRYGFAELLDRRIEIVPDLPIGLGEKTFWQDYKFVDPVTKRIEPKQASAPVCTSNSASTSGLPSPAKPRTSSTWLTAMPARP